MKNTINRAMRNELLKLVKAVQPGAGASVAIPVSDTKFCGLCAKPISKQAKFCADCGGAQA